jgi:prefoldin subunit 5
MKQVKLIQHPSDELDVMALFRNALLFFSHYGKLLLIVAFTGLLAGALRFWITPNIYSSSMVVQPVLLSDPEQMALIDNWSALLKKKELSLLADQLQVNKPLLKKVLSIKTAELQKSYAPNNYTAFTLTVLVTDTAVLQPLQRGIVYALDNSEYIKDKLAARKNNLRSFIQTLQQEITRLRNMQATIETNLQKQTNGGGFMVNISDISTQIANLQERKFRSEEELAFLSATHVLQYFYTPDKPTYPQLLKQLLMGLAGGLILGFVIAFYLHVRRKMAQST